MLNYSVAELREKLNDRLIETFFDLSFEWKKVGSIPGIVKFPDFFFCFFKTFPLSFPIFHFNPYYFR